MAIWRYCDHSARYLFGDAETDSDSNKLLLALTEGAKTQTELNNALSGHVSKERIKVILDHLQAAGRVTGEEVKTGGRPKTIWCLAPGFMPPKDISAEKARKSALCWLKNTFFRY